MATNVQRWIEDNKMDRGTGIIEESLLRKTLRKTLVNSHSQDLEESIDLVLNHLMHTGRLAKGVINLTSHNELKIVKVAQVGKTFETSQISIEEKAQI